MRVRLLAYTQQNPALHPQQLDDIGDLATLWRGQGAFPENLIEYAGRVCYRSTHRMGTAPEFISARVREGHEDIIEHVVVTLLLSETDEPLRWRMLNRHCEVSQTGDREWIVSGNTRVWLDLFRRGVALDALPVVFQVAPKVYQEFSAQLSGADLPSLHTLLASEDTLPAVEASMLDKLQPACSGPRRVTLLGFTQPRLSDADILVDHGSATFLFEGISRTCTHQLVRHRLASFSQESQRYVDLNKGGWKAIIPDAVAENPEAVAELDAFWQIAEEKYAKLRRLGIRKEDARFLLPNAAETRIITSMNFAAWSHFLWLRAVDKAAQWEIRIVGQHVLAMLYAIAPNVFQEHWDVFQERFATVP